MRMSFSIQLVGKELVTPTGTNLLKNPLHTFKFSVGTTTISHIACQQALTGSSHVVYDWAVSCSFGSTLGVLHRANQDQAVTSTVASP